MTITSTRRLRHGDLVTLTEENANGGVTTTTYRFIDRYTADLTDERPEPDHVDDDYDSLTAGSAIGQELLHAQVGATLTITHLDQTINVQFIDHQPA